MIKRNENIIKKKIYIKFGELVLKGKNRIQFVNCLFRNIKNALISYRALKIILNYDSIIIDNIENIEYQEIFNIIKIVPGINYVIEAYVIAREIKKLHWLLKKIIVDPKNKKSFKIFAKRIDKQYETNSLVFSQEIGYFILQNYKNLYVNVKQPQLKINIEIQQKNFIVYLDKIKGCGGLPVGMSGRVLMLISGGIDSPVAASLLMKKGFHVDFLSFFTPPHTTKKVEMKIKKLIKIIIANGKIEKPILYKCKFTNIQHEIVHITNHSYQITIMRRFFFKIAQHICCSQHYDAIATGESIGQVASQTIESINTISSVVNKTVILRPLLTFDKIEIIDIAKKINTYSTSILPYKDACSAFVPTNPVTKPTIKKALYLEKQLELIESIYKKVIDNDITREFICKK